MRKKVYKARLSERQIEDMVKQLEVYKDRLLNDKLQRFIDNLASRGIEIAKANVEKLDAVFTGELLDSFGVDKAVSSGSRLVFFIVTDSDHAAFVEFGTGQIGLEAPYPYPLPPGVIWKPNTGKTIFQLSDGTYGWFYPGKDGNWYFTMGMESRPFLYEAGLELMSEVEEIAKAVFR